MLHVQAVYGIVDAPDLNAELMEKVLEHSSRLANGPQIIGGDFNSPLGDLLKVPRSLAMALISRWLVDLDRELAEAEAPPCLCHFQGPAGTRPSRIDGCLADIRTASLATGGGGHGPGPATTSQDIAQWLLSCACRGPHSEFTALFAP